MSLYIPTLYGALREAIAAVWPDVLTNSNVIMEAEHAERVPWEDLKIPSAVIAAGRQTEGDWGGSNLAYETDVDIYRVQEVAGPSGTLVTSLETLRDRLRTVELSAGQVIAIPELVWDMSIEANQIFQQKRMTHRAGRLTARCVIGETL